MLADGQEESYNSAMPSIDREKAIDPKWQREFDRNRFVRLGGIIYYDEDYKRHHSKIAEDNGANRAAEYPYRPLVDDGGEIRIIDGKIAFGSTTSSCDINGPILEGRSETYRIAREILGEDVVHPNG